MTNHEMADLESLIDRYGLNGVVMALAAICNEKAEHVQSTWQDKALAKAWETNASRLDRVLIAA
jgi:hypothetical protein